MTTELQPTAAAILTAETSEDIKPINTDPNLYDADAVQRQTFTVSEAGEQFDTVHVLSPLSDERYVAFDKKCPTRITDDGNAISTEKLEASAELFDELCADIEGFDGEKPHNWLSLIDPVSEKLPSINTLIATVIVEAEKTSSGGRSWSATNEIVLEAYFNYPGIVSTKHFLRKKTISDGKTYERLQKIPINKSGRGLNATSDMTLPSMTKAKAQLYDQMTEKAAEGYANRVPVWHKAAIIDYVFRPSVSQKK